jgi:hypothetical protein
MEFTNPTEVFGMVGSSVVSLDVDNIPNIRVSGEDMKKATR